MHRIPRLILSFAATLLLADSLPAQESLNKGQTPSVAVISNAMKEFVDSNEVAGVVTLVYSKNKIAHLSAVGFADIDSKTPMRTDSIMWIASMTKPITGTAVMMLQDEGKLDVGDLVEKYIPEFADLKTLEGNPAKLTIRHLLTHTSGLGELTGQDAAKCKTLSEVIPYYLTKPVSFVPGSKWAYCQSGINKQHALSRLFQA